MLNYPTQKKKNGKGPLNKVYEVILKSTGMFYTAKTPTNKYMIRSDLIDFCQGLKINSKLDHPSIIKFIEYSPNNFKDKHIPVFITEFDKKKEILPKWNDTKKLINIYGIASAMSYLHSNDIIHRDLNLDNVFLDNNLYPKLSGFNRSKEIVNGISSETYKSHEYTKSNDVFRYSMIIYEIITKEKPFKFFSNDFDVVYDLHKRGIRPEINTQIPKCYRELIERCWSQDPKDRPTFEEILQTLKTNPEFITESVDKEEFYQYISTIDNSEITFNSNNIKYEQLTNFIKMDIRFYANFEDNINFIGIYDTETKNIDLNFKPFNIQNFIKKKKFYDEEICKHYEIVDPQTNKSYYAKEYALAIGKAETFEEISIFLIREIKVLSQANHPSIVKYYGFSSVDFKNRLRPVIITEFPPNGTLHQILELQHEGKSFPGWNDTKKLINVYGIASSMSYLHSHNVLHLFFISISCFFR